jgi:putative redox protein
MDSAKLTWQGGLKFKGVSAFGQEIITDGSKKAGGEEDGYKPSQLLLFAVAGCTGIDIMKILQKQRQEVTSLEIEVDGHQPDEYPKPYNRIEIKYTVKGSNLNAKKLEQAIKLSEEKYCSVSLTIKGSFEINTSYQIINE